eukprot:4543488-Pyramimonas_sp.AAC.2
MESLHRDLASVSAAHGPCIRSKRALSPALLPGYRAAYHQPSLVLPPYLCVTKYGSQSVEFVLSIWRSVSDRLGTKHASRQRAYIGNILIDSIIIDSINNVYAMLYAPSPHAVRPIHGYMPPSLIPFVLPSRHSSDPQNASSA